MAERQFWCLDPPTSTAGSPARVESEMDAEVVLCPLNDGHQREGRRLTDLTVVQPDRALEDFVWTCYRECLVQDHVLELFKASGFAGFEVRPVKSRFRSATAHEPPRLWELVITGWAGMAPPESGIKLIEHCPGCGYRCYSAWTNPERLIEQSQWDGSDFFIVWPLPGHIFVTDRAADLIRQKGLSGVVVRRSTDLAFPQSVIPTLGPGRLSYWMPQDRARELGAPLGIE